MRASFADSVRDGSLAVGAAANRREILLRGGDADALAAVRGALLILPFAAGRWVQTMASSAWHSEPESAAVTSLLRQSQPPAALHVSTASSNVAASLHSNFPAPPRYRKRKGSESWFPIGHSRSAQDFCPLVQLSSAARTSERDRGAPAR